jgi:hypothetical protein
MLLSEAHPRLHVSTYPNKNIEPVCRAQVNQLKIGPDIFSVNDPDVDVSN